uniref:succinate dehydrogenase subunit 3 n=1 Tax=Centroceras gasparrinii TaxID=371099 RepID=UPI002E78053C|nr:succinate dehydrogenase subunit 3 [Centroceras gasparrinii]WQF69491.1 succinate dehydrogenase subunit 3 [Centroceras gasparrinii]
MRLSFKVNRPISPHLIIYNTNLNLLRSIYHRFSGIFLTTILIGFLVFTKLFLLNCCIEVMVMRTFWKLFYFILYLSSIFLWTHLILSVWALIN